MSEWSYEHTWSLPAVQKDVFTALIDPTHLRRWFAEHVAIEPLAGGSYRFWGRSSYGVARAELATQRITRMQPYSTLAFRWLFDGSESEVIFKLEAEPAPAAVGATTRLALLHEFDSLPSARRPKELVDDLWRLMLGNLDAHLRGGAGFAPVDFTDPRPEIRVSLLTDASRERVFQALTDPAVLNQWAAATAVVEPRIGGRYTLGWTDRVDGREVPGPTQILEFVPNEKLVINWQDWRGDPTEPQTTVTWLLESAGARTRVILIHGGFARAADFSDYPFGWTHCLQKLQTVVESAAS
jgi:uncharacterized protein YndB with AHSA1/START domain